MKRIVPLPVEVPPDLASDVRARLHYSSSDLESFRLDLETQQLEYSHRGAESPEEVERKMFKVIQTMTAGFKRRKTRVLVDRRSGTPAYLHDPMPVLEQRGDVRKVGRGQYALGPTIVALAEYFEDEFRRIAGDMHAVAYRFPTLIEVRNLSRCNYFTSFSQSVSFVMHLAEDVDIIERFAGSVTPQTASVEPGSRELSAAEHVLSPAVCFHLYALLADRPLDANPLIAAAQGKCFRYESGNLGGLERLWDFSMHEIVIVGASEHVLAFRERSMQCYLELLDRLGLRYWIETATDPFFIGDFSARSAFQSALELKYEIRIDLPFTGTSIAAGSFNYHQNYFGKSFQIALPEGAEVAHTGCTAMGIERWVYGFLCQYGPDPAAWPAAVRERVDHA